MSRIIIVKEKIIGRKDGLEKLFEAETWKPWP